jgi:hypothetical protein
MRHPLHLKKQKQEAFGVNKATRVLADLGLSSLPSEIKLHSS